MFSVVTFDRSTKWPSLTWNSQIIRFIQPCAGLSLPTKKGEKCFKMSVTWTIAATRCGNYQNLKLHILISNVCSSALITLGKGISEWWRLGLTSWSSSVCPHVAVGHSSSSSSWHATLHELTVTFEVTCCAGGRRHLLRCTCTRLGRECRWRSLSSFCYIWGCYSYGNHYGLPNCTASHAWRA